MDPLLRLYQLLEDALEPLSELLLLSEVVEELLSEGHLLRLFLLDFCFALFFAGLPRPRFSLE